MVGVRGWVRKGADWYGSGGAQTSLELEIGRSRDGRSRGEGREGERAEVVVVVLVFGGGQVKGRAATYRKCFFCTLFTLS